MKKPSMVAFLITFMLVTNVCTHGEDVGPVMDTDGNQVEYNKQYYMEPINGGGLVPAAIHVHPICPLGITQTLIPYQPGLPVIFKLAFPFGGSKVQTFYPNSIEFQSNFWPFCNEFSKLWKVDDAKDPSVLIGGNPGEANSCFFFIFVRTRQGTGESIYKLASSTGTGYVGAISGAWLTAPQLVITNDTDKALLVTIKKVEDSTSSTSRLDKLGLRMFPFY